MTGCNLVRWVNENYFEESNIKEIYLYDSDRDDYKAIITRIQQDRDGRRFGWNTKRREMENYIPPSLIEDIFEVDLSKYKDDWKDINVIEILKQKVFTNIENLKEREKIIKNYLNGKLTKKITAEMLYEIDAYDELETFFKRVKTIYEERNDNDLYEA